MLAARVLRGAAALFLAAGVSVATAVAPSARAADPGPVELAIIAPIVAPPGSTGLIPADLLEQYTSPTGLLTRQLDAVAGRPVTLAIDPMILVSIRLLGSTASEPVSAWLARLEAVSNESFLLPYADSDVTLATQAGSSAVLAPRSLDFAIDPTLFGPSAEPTAEPTADPDMPALPTGDELLEWDSAFPDLVWPRAASVVGSDLGVLAASGFGTVILSSGNVSRDARLGPAVDVAGTSAIVTDDTVSAALDAAASTLIPDDLPAALGALRSAIAQAGAVQDGQAAVVASLDRSVPLTGNSVAATIAALESDAAVSLVPLSTAASGSTTGGASLVDSPQPADRVAVVARLLQADAAEERFATIVEDPTTITSPRRLALLGLLATGWEDNPTGWQTATDEFLEASTDLLGAVQIVTTSNFTLLADSATLPIPVRNDLGQSVTVYVTVRPETAQLAVTDTLVAVTIEPNAQARAQVPVQAISNGTVQVLITLTSTAGVAIGAPAVAEINVQAGWETPIVLVIAGIVVLVFGIGIVRNILRRRRARSAESESATDGGPAPEAPESDG
ncbi:DUF6049 family protein [Salinibacterium soli]|uniref:DUF6049 family protein n=1 Tax=Antiquaquibacter soli TaxID=3064523 RepID=A0ABT9BRT8_9MICO|nr:DUF6049 family protein [Protaetiibacter sp. WY-16]MDO7883163.1 DUF6049 family protein [Protaetiibacter sp. WY-16]